MPYVLAVFLLTAVFSVRLAASLHFDPGVTPFHSAAIHPDTARVWASLRIHFGLQAVMIFAPPLGTQQRMQSLVPYLYLEQKITPALVLSTLWYFSSAKNWFDLPHCYPHGSQRPNGLPLLSPLFNSQTAHDKSALPLNPDL